MTHVLFGRGSRHLWLDFAGKLARSKGKETPKMGVVNHCDNPLGTSKENWRKELQERRSKGLQRIWVSRESGSNSFRLVATMLSCHLIKLSMLSCSTVVILFRTKRESLNHGRLRTYLNHCLVMEQLLHDHCFETVTTWHWCAVGNGLDRAPPRSKLVCDYNH